MRLEKEKKLENVSRIPLIGIDKRYLSYLKSLRGPCSSLLS